MVQDLTTELHDLSPSTVPELLERVLNARCIEQDVGPFESMSNHLQSSLCFVLIRTAAL